VTHLVPNTYGWLVPLDKRSPTNSVPLDKWSQKIWSPWTNGLQQFGPHKQIVPRTFLLSRGQTVGIQKYGDQIGWGPFVLGDQIFGDHLSMGTICPWEPNLMGTICQGGSTFWDRLSQGTGSGGTEVRGSNGFETKCVAALIINQPQDKDW
jgi:hypothetical protein